VCIYNTRPRGPVAVIGYRFFILRTGYCAASKQYKFRI
jgi:hypothetical protein